MILFEYSAFLNIQKYSASQDIQIYSASHDIQHFIIFKNIQHSIFENIQNDIIIQIFCDFEYIYYIYSKMYSASHDIQNHMIFSITGYSKSQDIQNDIIIQRLIFRITHNDSNIQKQTPTSMTFVSRPTASQLELRPCHWYSTLRDGVPCLCQ